MSVRFDCVENEIDQVCSRVNWGRLLHSFVAFCVDSVETLADLVALDLSISKTRAMLRMQSRNSTTLISWADASA